MSYTSTDLITYAVGDGTTGTIQTPPFESDSDIVVLVRESGASTADTWVLDTDYTLSGAGTGANGTLTPITTKPDGSTIVIYTDPSPTLTFDFSSLPTALQSPLTSALHQLSLQVRSLKAMQRQYIKTSLFDLVAKNNAGTAAVDTSRLGKLFLWNETTGAPDVTALSDFAGPAGPAGAGGTPNGRTILEVDTVTDASAEFLSGATFELDPSNERHYNVQVGDSTTPLTANMTVDLAPDSSSWPDAAQVIITKGDLSPYTVTLSGLNADGLGTYTLRDPYDGAILGYHHTDDDDGPGTVGQKFKLVSRIIRPHNLVLKSASSWGADSSTILLNGQMGIELDTGLGKYGNGEDVWGDLGDYAFSVAIDIDGDTHTLQLRRDTAANWGSGDPTLAAGEAGYDTTNNALRIGDGSTAWSGLTPIAGSSTATAAFVLTSAITSATTLETTHAWYTSSAGTLTIRRVLIELGSPGRIDFAEDLPANTIFELYITEASAQVTLGIENDGGSIAEGESAGATLLPESGSIVSAVVVSNAGTAPIMHTLGNFSGAENVISGDLVIEGDLIAKTEVQIECFDSQTEVTTGDGAGYFPVPASLNGWNLVSVEASNLTAEATGSGSQTTDIQVHNLTQAADMLSTKLTIDEDEFNSSTATAAVIDTSNDDVATGDRLRIDIDAVPSTTGGTGLVVTLGFQKP